MFTNTCYRTGADHPNFINGYCSYRERALKHYGAKCKYCSYSVLPVLEVHHIDHNRKNNNIKNLMVVCPTHHKEVQYGIRNK